MILRITLEDINNGRKGDACGCPIALALRRLFPDAKHIYAMYGDIGIRRGDHSVIKFRPGPSANAFMNLFDNTLSACPTEVEIFPC